MLSESTSEVSWLFPAGVRVKSKGEVLRHIPELDGVRGIAVLAVMALHFSDLLPQLAMPWFVSRIIGQGGAGVDLFFVLSGFLITGILLATKNCTNYFRVFYARRALRIFPLYLFVVAVFFWAIVPMAQHHGKDLWIGKSEQIWYWLFLANWRHALQINDGAQLAHLWSLSVEEQFYLVWAVVVWLVNRRTLIVLGSLLPVTVFVLRTIAAKHGVSSDFIYYSTVTRLDTLAFGALLAASPAMRGFTARYGVFLFGLSVAAAMFSLPLQLSLNIYAIGSVSLVGLACSRSVPILRVGWLRAFGKYSYGLYVIHYLVHGALVPLAGRIKLQAVAQGTAIVYLIAEILGGIAISLLAAWFSWTVLESPFLSWKRYFRYQWQN